MPTPSSFRNTHLNGIDARLPSNPHSSALDSTDIAMLVGLALVSVMIILPGLGVQSLATWDEAIYGVVTREMLARPGATLHYSGHPWFEKPPFFFWLMTGSSSIFGLSEFALRLPAALFGVTAVVLQYLAGRRLGGRCAGVMAAVFLLGVPQFVAYSRLAMTDVPLTALGLLSVVFVVYGNEQNITMAGAGAAFGLAILTKSVAAFLFVPGLIAIVVALRGPRALWSKEVLLAFAVALIVALPWHIWSVVSYGRSFVEHYLFFHVIARFATPLEGHHGDAFAYFATYSSNTGWLAPVHVAGIVLASALALLKRDRILAAAVVLALGAFMIVNAQGTKIGWYLIPVYPGAALAAALGITRCLRHSMARFAAVLCAIALAAPGVIHGRELFVQEYNILDYSPEVRSLRNAPPFGSTRVPLLYTMALSNPAPRFYLANRVQSVDRAMLERLLAAKRPFLCLTFKTAATEFLNKHSEATLKIAAATESLAVIEHE